MSTSHVKGESDHTSVVYAPVHKILWVMAADDAIKMSIFPISKVTTHRVSVKICIFEVLEGSASMYLTPHAQFTEN